MKASVLGETLGKDALRYAAAELVLVQRASGHNAGQGGVLGGGIQASRQKLEARCGLQNIASHECAETEGTLLARTELIAIAYARRCGHAARLTRKLW